MGQVNDAIGFLRVRRQGTDMEEDDAIQAYWSGGPGRVRLLHAPGAFPSDDLAQAMGILEDFRAECHKGYFASNGLLNGRLAMLATLEDILENGARHMGALKGSSGSSPDAAGSGIRDGLPPSRGRQKGAPSSVPTDDCRYSLTREKQVAAGKRAIETAEMNTLQFLDSLAKGGEFEDWHNKAFVVMLYQRWEGWYRLRIAEALGLEKKNKVRCALMGEVRQLRHVIIHRNGVVTERFSARLLSRIWGGIPLGFLFITDDMVTALMEQLNAVLVEVG